MKRWLGRTADPDGRDSHVRTVDDTRVPPPGQGSFEQTVERPREAAQAEASEWTRELHRVSPTRAAARGLSEDVADHIASAARFDTEEWGLTVQVRADRHRGQACLLDPGGSVLGEGEEEEG